MITGDFDVEILRDLINEGYSGQELLDRFIKARDAVPEALEKMFEDLLEKANGEFYTLEDVFGDDQK